MLRTIFLLFATGVLFGAGPCLLSCGPVLTAYVCGRGCGWKEGVRSYALFSAARIAVYIGVSLAVYFLGQVAASAFFADYDGYVFIAAGFFLILIGLMVGFDSKIKDRPFTYIYAYILRGDRKNEALLGLLFGLMPCAPLFAVLAYIGMVSKSVADNVIYTVSFSLGSFFSPLLLLCAVSAILPALFKRNRWWKLGLRIVCGAVISAMGVWLVVKGVT